MTPISVALVGSVAIIALVLLVSFLNSDFFFYCKYRVATWIGGIICKVRGHHNFEWKSYGGLGGSYCVKKCTFCDKECENSFIPEETL